VYLVQGQMLPYGRASLLLREVFGLQVSAGSLAGWVRTCSQALTEVETRIKAGLRKARVIHQDETGVRVRKHHSYVHVCSTPQLTHFGYHPSRGRVALNAIGILTGFGGTSIHDGLNIYPGYPCQHALCNVHHLRELTFVEEELKQPWAKKMKELLLDMKEEVAQARQAGQTQLDVVKLANFHFQYGALIREGFELNPKVPPPLGRKRVKQSPAWNLLDRLNRYRRETLRFLHDFAVAFDNNQAERDLRMIKVQQKVSGEFRTDHGADAFCRIRSYLSTLRKQGPPLFSALQQALAGHPVLPTFSSPESASQMTACP
jgi:transposase